MTISRTDQSFPTIPDRFEFYYGSFSGNSLYCTLDSGGSITLERTNGGNFSGSIRTLHPDREQWAVFRSQLDVLIIWDWQPEYSAAHGCCGVTYWHIVLDWDENHLASRGANAFPGGAGPSPSPEFSRFLDALAELTGETVR